MWSFRLFRREHDQKQIEQTQDTIQQRPALQIQNSTLDAFLGRKTQAPFPLLPEAVRVEGFLKSRELQPPDER